ncbi:MAG: hypothetical protein V3V05_07215 [Pontiella sp.]
MKRLMSIAAIALFMAGSSVFACDSCGCKAKKAEAACTACKDGKTCKTCAAKKAEKKCPEGCTKDCCKK